MILAYCSRASNERTYQEVVWAVCGKVPGVLCEVAIAVYTFGTCIAFLIIIGDQQDKSECSWLPRPWARTLRGKRGCYSCGKAWSRGEPASLQVMGSFHAPSWQPVLGPAALRSQVEGIP